jgi:SAM-dependent methyltransferase
MSAGEATTSNPDESLWTRLQYRILKRIAPTDRSRMTGSAYAGTSKLRVLLGDDLLTRIKGKDVLDFGCGVGAEAVEMASEAHSVYGLDILTASLEKARQRAEAAGVSHKCTFGSTAPSHPIDAIISLDSFEHFGDPADILRTMYTLLRPGGQVLVSFGPPWKHPLGGHLFAVFPWAHLIFSEAALIRWRSDFRADGAKHFGEVEGGLNQMTISRFERLVAESAFRLVQIEVVPIRRLKPVANRMTREFTTAIVRCVLERPIGAGGSGNAPEHLAGTP